MPRLLPDSAYSLRNGDELTITYEMTFGGDPLPKGRQVNKRTFYEKQIERYSEQLAQLDRFGEDDFEDGDVLRFDKKFHQRGQVYSYAAIKANGLWYTTGPNSPKAYTWDELVQFLPDEVWYVTEYEKL